MYDVRSGELGLNVVRGEFFQVPDSKLFGASVKTHLSQEIPTIAANEYIERGEQDCDLCAVELPILTSV